jgi:hypothetical protein
MAAETFPASVSKTGASRVLAKPSEEFWLAEDDGAFVRGEICFFSDEFGAYRELLDNYHCHVVWNYAAITNATVEKWSKDAEKVPLPRFAMLHSNRVAGADYLVVRSNLPGMSQLISSLVQPMPFDPWTDAVSPLESALSDCASRWQRKWFMQPQYLEPAKAVIYATFAR